MASSSLPIVDGGSGISTCLRTVRNASVGSTITFSDCERFNMFELEEARFLVLDTAIAVYMRTNDVIIDTIVTSTIVYTNFTHALGWKNFCSSLSLFLLLLF